MVWVEVSKMLNYFLKNSQQECCIITLHMVRSFIVSMYVCMFVVAAPWSGWLAWSIYISHVELTQLLIRLLVVCGENYM